MNRTGASGEDGETREDIEQEAQRVMSFGEESSKMLKGVGSVFQQTVDAGMYFGRSGGGGSERSEPGVGEPSQMGEQPGFSEPSEVMGGPSEVMMGQRESDVERNSDERVTVTEKGKQADRRDMDMDVDMD